MKSVSVYKASIKKIEVLNPSSRIKVGEEMSIVIYRFPTIGEDFLVRYGKEHNDVIALSTVASFSHNADSEGGTLLITTKNSLYQIEYICPKIEEHRAFS